MLGKTFAFSKSFIYTVTTFCDRVLVPKWLPQLSPKLIPKQKTSYDARFEPCSMKWLGKHHMWMARWRPCWKQQCWNIFYVSVRFDVNLDGFNPHTTQRWGFWHPSFRPPLPAPSQHLLEFLPPPLQRWAAGPWKAPWHVVKIIVFLLRRQRNRQSSISSCFQKWFEDTGWLGEELPSFSESRLLQRIQQTIVQ